MNANALAYRLNADYELRGPQRITPAEVRAVASNDPAVAWLPLMHPLARLPDELRASIESRILQETDQ